MPPARFLAPFVKNPGFRCTCALVHQQGGRERGAPTPGPCLKMSPGRGDGFQLFSSSPQGRTAPARARSGRRGLLPGSPQTDGPQAGQRAVPGTGEHGMRSASGSAETRPRGHPPAEDMPSPANSDVRCAWACEPWAKPDAQRFLYFSAGRGIRVLPGPPWDPSEWNRGACLLWARRSGRPRRSPSATRVPSPHCQVPVRASLLGEAHGLGANEEHKAGAPRGDGTDARLRPAPAERRGVAAR